MARTVLGIDPGQEGGFAVLDGDSVIVEPMPLTEEGRLDFQELGRLLGHYAESITHAYIEKVQPMPFNGSIGAFKLGHSLGALEAMLTVLGVRYSLVAPVTWSKAYQHGVLEKENRNRREKAIKVARRGIVAKLYPGIDLKKSARSSVPHEGMVDALLIADYGFNINNTQGRNL